MKSGDEKNSSPAFGGKKSQADVGVSSQGLHHSPITIFILIIANSGEKPEPFEPVSVCK